MIKDLYAPGSFNDAIRYALDSMPQIVKRWWPLYLIVLACSISIQYLSNPIPGNFIGLLSGSIIEITCAVHFRGSLRMSAWLIRGFLLTSILVGIAFSALRLLQPHHLPRNALALVYLFAYGLYAWIAPKLSGASNVFLLETEPETVLDAYAISWSFISGEVWWRFFSVSLIGGIPLVIVAAVLLRIAPPHSSLVMARYLLNGIASTAYGIYFASAAFRIIGTAPQLRARYREAYQKTAE